MCDRRVAVPLDFSLANVIATLLEFNCCVLLLEVHVCILECPLSFSMDVSIASAFVPVLCVDSCTEEVDVISKFFPLESSKAVLER